MEPKKGFFRQFSDWLTIPSHWIWILTGLLALIGVVVACGGVYIEAKSNEYKGLLTIILSPSFFVLSGIGATVAAKLEAEEKQKERDEKINSKKKRPA